jgi:hypothetical protein
MLRRSSRVEAGEKLALVPRRLSHRRVEAVVSMVPAEVVVRPWKLRFSVWVVDLLLPRCGLHAPGRSSRTRFTDGGEGLGGVIEGNGLARSK